MKVITILVILSMLVINTVCAGEADVLTVDVERTGDNTFYFEVTVVHSDEGWDHYADKWDVVAPDGAVLATRVLHHPHEKEQPFTRSLGGVKIPAGINTVSVQAHDSVHRYGGKVQSVRLPR